MSFLKLTWYIGNCSQERSGFSVLQGVRATHQEWLDLLKEFKQVHRRLPHIKEEYRGGCLQY